MTSSWVVMVTGDNGTVEGQVVGDIDMALVHKDISVVVPIR